MKPQTVEDLLADQLKGHADPHSGPINRCETTGIRFALLPDGSDRPVGARRAMRISNLRTRIGYKQQVRIQRR